MRIKLFEKLFKPPESADSGKIKQQETVKPNTTGMASVRDSFEKSGSQNYFSGKRLESGDFQKEQDYVRKENPDDVLIEFQPGETRSPYFTGGLWNSSESAPEEKNDSDEEKKKRD